MLSKVCLKLVLTMVWDGGRFFDLLGKPKDLMLKRRVEKTHVECSYCAQGLEDHAPRPIYGSSMSLTTCLRYVLTIAFDGLTLKCGEGWTRTQESS